MTIAHHPPEALVTSYAAGLLDRGEHIVVATHLVRCDACRLWVRAVEQLGGAFLDDLPPSPIAEDAISCLEARGQDRPARKDRSGAEGMQDVPGLPAFVRRLPAGAWRWVAPGLRVRRIGLPDAEPTRVFLLKARAGVKLMQHTHTGIEMTCVLKGSFGHDGACFAPGDFDLGDPATSHTIEVGPESECISLVAMRGELRLNGLIGRLVQPMISL